VKPKIRTATYKYWFCGVEGCQHHKTEEAAQACIDERERPKRVTNTWDEESRRALLDRYRTTGESMAAIGRSLGITGSRVRDVLAKAEREERKRSN